MPVATLQEKVLFIPWQHRKVKVSLNMPRWIFKNIVRGLYNKYHVKVLLYLYKHSPPRNIYTLSKLLNSNPHRIKLAVDDLISMEIISKKLKPIITKQDRPITKIHVSRPAYSFMFASPHASLLMIRVMLVATKYYRKITDISDIKEWIDDHHISRIEEVFTILRDKLAFLYAKNFSEITKTYKRKEQKENNSITRVFKPKKGLVKNAILLSNRKKDVFQILGGGNKKLFVVEGDNSEPVVSMFECNLKRLSKYNRKVLAENPGILYDPPEHIMFEGKRIINPLYEVSKVFCMFDEILNKHYVKKGIHLDRKNKANITVALRFYYFCKKRFLDIEYWMNEVYKHCLSQCEIIRFTYLVSDIVYALYRNDRKYDKISTENYLDLVAELKRIKRERDPRSSKQRCLDMGVTEEEYEEMRENRRAFKATKGKGVDDELTKEEKKEMIRAMVARTNKNIVHLDDMGEPDDEELAKQEQEWNKRRVLLQEQKEQLLREAGVL